MDQVKLEVDLEELRKRHLYIATPAYGGGTHSNYVTSLLQLQRLLQTYAIPHTIQFMYNESLISRARNKLVDLFRQTDVGTDLLFIDADIEFDPQDVIVLMHYNKEIIGGAYPLKTINWENVRRAILKNPEIPVEAIAHQGAEWAIHPYQGKMELATFQPVEVDELATGFMMIKREVFETMKDHVPSYKPYSKDVTKFERVPDFFFVGTHGDRYESEDYSFCRRWHELGGKVWLCPWMKLTHHGSFPFRGDLISLANNLGEIH